MGFYFESFLNELILALLIFITTIFVYVKYLHQHWTRNNIVQLEPKFPFGDIGKILLKKESFSVGFCNMYQKFKRQKVSFGGYYFTFRPELMILDPDIIKQILIKDFNHFPDRGTFSDENNDPLTGHLFSLDGKKWKNLRAKLTPTFTSGKMKMMFNTLVACSDELNNIVRETTKNNAAIDIKDILARFTMDVIGSCAFGIDCNSLKDPNTDFRKYGQLCFEPPNIIDKFRRIGAFLLPNIYKFFKITTLNKDITNFFMGIVKETVKYREENNISRKDFMQLLIQLKNGEQSLTDDESVNMGDNPNEKKNFTIEQIAAQCFVFFIAGYETTSTAMTFCLYELVKNPEIQEKLLEEINTVLNKYNGKLCYDAIMEMHYMEKVINEALRKYPPLSFLNRKCVKDYPLPKSNYIIREGDYIRISILGLQRDSEYYPNPEKFDPERFSEEQKSTRPSYTFIPFGEGPRVCIGLRFGMMQTKVALTVLLKNYKFTLNKKTPDPLIMDPNNFIMSAMGGIWLNAQHISS